MNISERLAVCSWSLQPEDPATLVAAMGRCRMGRTQLWLDPLREGGAWADGFAVLKDAGIEVISGMMTCEGEDYTTLGSIRETGGVVPDAVWPKNLANFEKNLDLAAAQGLGLVTFHAGFIPEEAGDPKRPILMDRMRQVANLCRDRSIRLGLETGQETAATLIELLDELATDNITVNFDPANMILYDKDEPIEALKQLMPYVGQCHAKDAIRTESPGEWGQEVAVGDGQVDWAAFFQVLESAGYDGDVVLEREAGEQRVADVLKGRSHILGVVGEE